MRPIRALARPLVAAPYIITGLDTLRDPRARAERVGPSIKPIADRLDWLPTKDPEALVRAEGALSLGTGVLLLTGRLQRVTAFLLAAQLVPVLGTEHRYWTEDDPERRAAERSQLLKSASLFGALLMVATEPRRSARAAELRHAVREARTQAEAETRAVRRETAAELKNARREAARQVRDARRRAALRRAKARRAAVAGKASKATGKAARSVQEPGRKAVKAAKKSKVAKAVNR